MANPSSLYVNTWMNFRSAETAMGVEDIIKLHFKCLIVKYIPAIDYVFKELSRITPSDRHPLHRQNCNATVVACLVVEEILEIINACWPNALEMISHYSRERFIQWDLPEDKIRAMFWNTTGHHIAAGDIRSLYWKVHELIRDVYKELSFSKKVWNTNFPLTLAFMGGRVEDDNFIRKGWVFADVSPGRSAGWWNI